jgi:excisionase family DNA binding protein
MNTPRTATLRGDHPNAVIAPLAVKPRLACQMLSCGTTRLYELLGVGELEHYRDGRSRLITVASIEAYVARKIAEAHGEKAT